MPCSKLSANKNLRRDLRPPTTPNEAAAAQVLPRTGHSDGNGHNGYNTPSSYAHPLATTTNYTYDGEGRLATATDARSNTTTYQYDARSHVTQIAYADGSAHNYDGNGNLVTGNGLYMYDAQNRLNYAQQGSTIDQISYDSRNRVVERTVNGTPTAGI
jgi:YD repeat-containing protein